MKTPAVSLSAPDNMAADIVRDLYLESFPPEERRPWEQILHPASPAGPRLNILHLDGDAQPRGLVTVWEFDNFRYIEHFAVDSAMRGAGIGAAALELLRQTDPRPLVLEVERPDSGNPMAERRIGFYSRNGFVLNTYNYIQPPYAPGLPEVPLYLMSTAEDFNPVEVAATLRRHVYGN